MLRSSSGKRTIALAALLLASCGEGDGTPDIRVTDAWARETVAGQSSTAAYMTITNNGSAADRLIGVLAEAPAKGTLHATSHDAGISRMRAVDALDVPAGGSLRLRPAGTHVMMQGLPGPARPGDVLHLRLRFDRSGEHAVEVQVRDAAVESSSAAHRDHQGE